MTGAANMAVQSWGLSLPLSAGIEQDTDKQDNQKSYNIKIRVFGISLTLNDRASNYNGEL